MTRLPPLNPGSPGILWAVTHDSQGFLGVIRHGPGPNSAKALAASLTGKPAQELTVRPTPPIYRATAEEWTTHTRRLFPSHTTTTTGPDADYTPDRRWTGD